MHTAARGSYLMVGLAKEDDRLVEATQAAEDLLAREKRELFDLGRGLLLLLACTPFLLLLLSHLALGLLFFLALSLFLHTCPPPPSSHQSTIITDLESGPSRQR
jgi:hypothetical protein